LSLDQSKQSHSPNGNNSSSALIQSKSVNKDKNVAKTTERMKNKSKQAKDSEHKIISSLNRFVCPHKHNGISYFIAHLGSVFTKYEF